MLKPRALRTVARYVEHFERIDTTQGKERREVWIVFRDEGESLHHLLYTDDATTEDGPTTEGDDDGEEVTVSSTVDFGARAGEGAGADETADAPPLSVVMPSRFWHKIKADSVDGASEAIREILRQVLSSLAELHSIGVTHRDVKPENLIVSLRGVGSEGRVGTPLIRLADFGSADTTPIGLPPELWPSPLRRPSRAELTTDYESPEVIFAAQPDAETDRSAAYDIWSVGVMLVELVIGTSKVWGVSDRARSIIEALLPQEDAAVKEMAFTLRSMADLCVFVPELGDELPTADGAAGSAEQRKARRAAKRAGAKGQTADAACGDAEMASSLQQRDPHGVGLPSASGRDLLRRLLAWEPTERIMASEALEHPFLQPSEEH